MKLDKIRFGMLVSWITRRGNVELDAGDCSDLDNLIDVEGTVNEAVYPSTDDIHMLMFLMYEGTRKIEAIKLHRKLTGYGLKESKDMIEKYWLQKEVQRFK